MPATLGFSDVETLLRAPLIGLDQIRPGMVVVGGAPHDSTHSSRTGARMGPKGIREGSLAFADKLRRVGEKGLVNLNSGRQLSLPHESRLVDVGDYNVYPSDVIKSTEGIASGVAEVVRRGAMSVCLGGDHFTSYPSCLGYTRALAETKPNTKIGYIHIDGHLDFTDVNPVWGRYNHGSNARRISEIDMVSLPNMVWIGINGWVSEDAVNIIEGNGARIFSALDVHDQGPVEVARQAADHAINGCEFIYLTVDVDFIDTGFFPATGSVVNDSITPLMCLQILRELSRYPIGAMDLVEVSPRIDPTDRSLYMSTELLLGVIEEKIFDVSQIKIRE